MGSATLIGLYCPKGFHGLFGHLWAVSVSSGPSCYAASVLVGSQVMKEFLHVLISGLHFTEVSTVIGHDIGISPRTILMILNDLVIIKLVKAISSSGEINGSLVIPWCEECSYIRD
jgi:hypothetical protein